MKRRKILTGVLSAVLLLIIVLLFGIYFMFHGQLKAMKTIEKLDTGLYFMEYKGDYGFDDFLAQGGADSDEAVGVYLSQFLSHGFYSMQPETGKQGCSTIQTKTQSEGYLFGRNYDWKDCTVMIVQTKPDNGYASISTCNMDFLRFGEDYLPESFLNKMLALSAVYVPLDGMNEKGLCVADLMIDTEETTNQNTGKVSLTTTTAIRLILDHAATVEEALDLLSKYDMHSSAGMMHHLAIADVYGNSVVVEYIDNEMKVTETPVVTNFYLTPGEKYGIGSEQSKQRYEILNICLADENCEDMAQLKSALQSVSQKEMGAEYEMTVWSILYDQKERSVEYYFRENFEESYRYELK